MNYKLINEEIKGTPFEQVLINRGIKKENIQHFLNTTEQDLLSPSLLVNIDKGIDMLMEHVENKSLIAVQVDPDVDGFTSSSFCINYLSLAYGMDYVRKNVIYFMPDGKHHGINLELVKKYKPNLVIAPDSSSNEYDEHRLLKEMDIDVLVLDHHEAERMSENACVINNQLCDYPNKTLSGVGVVYKFFKLYDEVIHQAYADEMLDLVAIGMVSDMMRPIEFETKYLISKGLSQIKNPFFRAFEMKNSFTLKGEITPYGVSMYIAPSINATIRVGTDEEKLVLFESMLLHKAYESIPSTKRGCKGTTELRTEQACRNCTNIKNRQTKIRDEMTREIKSLIEKKALNENKILFIQTQDLNKNMTGLIANELQSKYQKPVLLLNKTIEDGAVVWSGSGRGISNSDFDNFKDWCIASKQILYAQGHQNAFGFSIEDIKVDSFLETMNNLLAKFKFDQSYKVDVIFDGANFKAKDILEIAQYPREWGKNEEPFIAISSLNLNKQNTQLLSKDKNPTIKITLPNGVEIMKFKSSVEEYEELTNTERTNIDLVGSCTVNEWNGRIKPQILVIDYCINQKSKYYF